MQLTNIKISNLLSFPYQPDLSKVEGIKFYNRENNNVNVFIWPNGAGKSWFLHILKQILRIWMFNDYMYDKQLILSRKESDLQYAIQTNDQHTEWLYAHFTTPYKPSQVIAKFVLTQHDYDNLKYIAKYSDILNMLVKKYSTLSIQYPFFSDEQIHAIPASFTLDCAFDTKNNNIMINEKNLSHEGQFVYLYLQTVELIQIFIDIFNEFERKEGQQPLIPLKNSIWFLGTNRSLKHVSNIVDPHARDNFIWSKASYDYHSYVWFYLCAKKVRNIISDHSTLDTNTIDVADYSDKLNTSEFYTSLTFIIKRYFNKDLSRDYADGLLNFILTDEFGQHIAFAELSDGEQSLLSMVFTMYGYDLNHGMIIIDEPETHFHPQMQRSFSRMIERINQNIGTQFVLSTYSPLFINESNIGNVYRFAKIGGETKVQNPYYILPDDEATLVHLLKFENLSKIFFVNNIIMVEGETDAYFFEFYMRYLHALPQWKDKLKDFEILNINGKWSYRVRSKFLARFGLQSFFIGDRDNIVDYGFMTQDDLWYYYKQARAHYAGLKKSGKTHRHYNKLVDTIRNVFPQKYRYLLANIDNLYKQNVFILKKWDIETYLGMREKWLEETVKFCHYDFKKRLENKNFDACRQEFIEIFGTMFK